jgi:hypothetical protein
VPAAILADLPAKSETVQIGHQQVGNDSVHRMALQESENFVAIRGNDDRMTFSFQYCTQEPATGLVVISDEDFHWSSRKKQLPL